MAEAPVPTSRSDQPVEPVTKGEYVATGVLAVAFVATMGIAILLALPFQAAGLDQVFEDPDSPTNPLWYILLIIVFTAFILWLAHKGFLKVIQFLILGAVAGTVLYLGVGILNGVFGVHYDLAGILGLAAGIGSAIWLYKNPEWYVLDIVGLMVAAVAATIFGINLSPVPVLILLVLLAVYDAIAVYKTKHMLSLADTVIDLRLPVLMVVPKHRGYSFKQEATKMQEASKATKGEREAMFMGLGDLVMPSILVVSAFHFGQFETPQWGVWLSLGAAVGTLLGFGALMVFVLRGNPQAGLPLLNGGAILGFLTAMLFAIGPSGMADYFGAWGSQAWEAAWPWA